MRSSLLCVLGICLLAGCSKQTADVGAASPLPSPVPQATPTPKLLVMATIAPMYCFTKNVTGDLADVELIVPPSTPARGFQPSPDVIRKIRQADMIIENGFGFEDWMDNLVSQGLKPGAIRVIAARGTGPGIPGLPGDPNTPPGGAPADASGPPNPHVWLDPLMAIKELQNIRDALMARDPVHANDYLAHENRYEAALRDLDDEVGRTTVDITKRRLLCVSDTFSYFLSRYEFSVVAPVPPPIAVPNAKAPEADAVLVSSGTEAGILNRTGLPIVIADPMETGSASTDFYENGTRANANALREGLLR